MNFAKKTMVQKKIKEGKTKMEEIQEKGIQEEEIETKRSKEAENRDMNYYTNAAADIPECRERSSLESEYKDFPEEQIWVPKPEIDHWIYLYYLLGRSILTFVQESQGISNNEAMENSCTGNSEQYAMDVLHSCEYVPEVALKTLHKTELPKKLHSRWDISDIKLFSDGIARHGKNFNKIQRDLLPQKETKELVEFYYSWKWSASTKTVRNIRRRGRSINQRHIPSICYKSGVLSSAKKNEASLGNTTDIKNEVQPTRKSARRLASRKISPLVTRPPTKRKRNSKDLE